MFPQQYNNILNVMTEDEFNKHAIIKPPESDVFVSNDKRTTRLVIDSMFRDKTQYPNPNNYCFIFDDDVNDVVSAKLLSIDIPFANYLINTYFNKLYISINNEPQSIIELPIGNYSRSELANIITSCIQSIFDDIEFNVMYNVNLDSFIFTCSVPFKLFFQGKPNSLESLLGFENKDYVSNINGSINKIQAPYRCNFNYNNYIVMCINGFDNNKSNSKPLNKSFAIISNIEGEIRISDDLSILKSFNPPLSRLPKITISFYDRYGNPYDFQNMDHRFELLLQSMKQRPKYQNIFGLKK